MPALEAAKSAVNALSQADVTEVKKFTAKIYVVAYVMDTINIFKGEKLEPIKMPPEAIQINKNTKSLMMNDSYDTYGKAVLSDMKFLESLKGYDKETINDEHIELLVPYTS